MANILTPDDPLELRCLALTGSFETSSGIPDCFCGLTGDFDGMGMSFGALQWNLGQGTLQPMFTSMLSGHADVCSTVCGDNLDVFTKMLAMQRPEQLEWARTIQSDRHTVTEPWKSLFTALARTPEFQAIQMTQAQHYFDRGEALRQKFGLVTERAAALMFDICVQNGTIAPDVEAKIRADWSALPDSGDAVADEAAKLQSVANRRAEAANPKFVEDVRRRKLAIANGSGVVHGRQYNLEQDYAIRLTAI